MRLIAHLRVSFWNTFRAFFPQLQEIRVPLIPVMLRHRHVPRPSRRRGLTLVEMLVSVALTLMVVFALVRVFELLGDNVADGRATMEMSGNLHSAASLLRDDLANITVTTRPWRSREQSEGYYEIVDGPATDFQTPIRLTSGPSVLSHVGTRVDAMPAAPKRDGFLDTGDPYDTSVGDVDDVLALTARRASAPYTGTIVDPRIRLPRVLANGKMETDGAGNLQTYPLVATTFPTRMIESPEAEIVWWLQVERNLVADEPQAIASLDMPSQLANYTGSALTQTARIASAQRYPNFTGATLGTPVRSLHRRVLLIRPDLDLSLVRLASRDEVAAFLSNNDISVSIRWNSEVNAFVAKANSLGDLAFRHNRAYHQSYDFGAPGSKWAAVDRSRRLGLTRISPETDEVPVDSGIPAGEMLAASNLLLRHAALKNMVLERPFVTPRRVMMMRKGRDIVLSDVLAFDIQVWDPEAVMALASDGVSLEGTALSPGDPGYLQAAVGGAVAASKGSYVDLGFAVAPKSTVSGVPTGLFGGLPHPRSRLNLTSGIATYCTWCKNYEHDGIDQYTSGATKDRYEELGLDPAMAFDEATNRFDDDNRNGVDDPGELETSPPYPHPLRGMLVKIRVMDLSTRQVRQTSVATDFLPE